MKPLMEVSLPQTHRCHVCHRRYKRPEHLQRHLATHSVQRPYVCGICKSGFKRSDVLKRHMRTCTGSLDTSSRSLTKRRACDRCVRAKRACNSGHPCQTCLQRQVDCVYTSSDLPDVATTVSSAAESWTSKQSGDCESNLGLSESMDVSLWTGLNDMDLFNFASESWNDFLDLPPTIPMVMQEDETRPSLHFLDNFTKHTGFVKSFECGTIEQRTDILQQAEYLALLNDTVTTHHTKFSADSLQKQSVQICELVKEVITVKPRNSCVDLSWSFDVENRCRDFFAPSNLFKFLELFWAVWHPNVNFVHRPTFESDTSKAVLVAAMAIIGACVSPDPTHKEAVSVWFNCVEEIVFIDDDFCEDDIKSKNEFPSHAKIQSLQAAYMVCLYQNWEGTDKSKRRIRRHRFGTLIAVARDIGIENSQRQRYPYLDERSFNWNEFMLREQLIRVLTWTFLLDTAFVIFNNLPPRMVMKEMKMDMVCCEAIFQATTATECFSLLREDAALIELQKKKTKWTFDQATEQLCLEEIDPSFYRWLANQGPLNLFAITSSLHSLIFHYQNSLGSEGQLGPIRNALENWKLVWTLYMDEFSLGFNHNPVGHQELNAQNLWKRVGFVRHAAEYWLLASLILDRITSAQPNLASSRREEKSNSETLPEGIQPAVLKKYDETSMEQINDLIADLQRTTLA